MKCSFFENVKSVAPKGRDNDVFYFLNRIKMGVSNDLISKIRTTTSAEEKKAAKAKLPAVTFAGRFSQRSISGLKEPSGLAILDIDKSSNVQATKDLLIKNPLTFSCWISPSGDGVKLLVKIPIVENGKEYTARYKKIVEELSKGWDANLGSFDKTSDISRLCFESSDSELYLNPDSETFHDIEYLDLEPFVPEIGTFTNIPLTDHNEIANKILKYWNDKHFDRSMVNTSLFKLASYFNEFGIDRGTALSYCMQFKKPEAPAIEVEKIIKSAYSKTFNFGTKQFIDGEKKKKLNALILKGKPVKAIISEFKEIDPEKLEAEITSLKADINIEHFWDYDDNGKVEISSHRYKFYLESKDFYKHYPSGEKTFTFLKKDGNFITEIHENNIKDYVLDILMTSGELKVYDYMAKSKMVFDPKFLSMIDVAEFSMHKDTQDKAYLYFNNTAVEVTKKGVKKIPYNDLDGFVWKKQVVDRDFIEADHHESEYRTFIWRCAGENPHNYNSMKSVIGYLLHSYKSSTNNRAIIFNDEMISDNPNGGSGKSLFCTAVGKIKNVSKIDGKTFDFKKSFPYQTVAIDSQVLVFDDVKRSFNFENLFSVITEGITLEYKNQPAIKLDVSESPKIVITTNYTIKGEGGSFERRVFEIEMSSHYNSNFTPEDEFGHRLFDNWDEKEWARFDRFMVNCLQYYLQNGLMPFHASNLDYRRIINETDKQFLDWIDTAITFNNRIDKRDFFNKFKADNSPDFDKMTTSHIFTKWLKSYATWKGYDFEENSTNGHRWFQFTDSKNTA